MLEMASTRALGRNLLPNGTGHGELIAEKLFFGMRTWVHICNSVIPHFVKLWRGWIDVGEGLSVTLQTILYGR